MKRIAAIIMIATLAACHSKTSSKINNGLITLTNGPITASFCAYGARLVSLTVPDKNGKAINVVWGFDKEQAYKDCKTDPYYGATIGRYGNRIANALFQLDNKTYRLDKNGHQNSLHGGKNGFNTKEWNIYQKSDTSITFSYTSNDGESGYPGNLEVKVTYTLTKTNGLKILYEATTNAPTVVNLTNHAFWNLNGAGSGTVLKHTLKINADKYTPVDTTLIPTGKLDSVAQTPFDFRKGKVIGIRINDHNQQLTNGKGYDHNFVLNSHGPTTPVAEAIGDQSGIRMQVFTDQPGLQFYTGNFMAGKNTMNGGAKDNYREAFCLETQHFPDSPNQAKFPSTVLNPGEVYKTTTIYQFSNN